MSKRISFFSKNLTIFSTVISLLYTYYIVIERYIYIGFYLSMMFIVILTTFNSIYLFNIKDSLLDKMNIKKKRVYGKLYLLGVLSYLPLIIIVVIYSLYDYSNLGLIGVELIIIQAINMILVSRTKNIRWVYITFIISILSLLILYMIGLTKVMNG